MLLKDLQPRMVGRHNLDHREIYNGGTNVNLSFSQTREGHWIEKHRFVKKFVKTRAGLCLLALMLNPPMDEAATAIKQPLLLIFMVNSCQCLIREMMNLS